MLMTFHFFRCIPDPSDPYGCNNIEDSSSDIETKMAPPPLQKNRPRKTAAAP